MEEGIPIPKKDTSPIAGIQAIEGDIKLWYLGQETNLWGGEKEKIPQVHGFVRQRIYGKSAPKGSL
ncbi:MAG: hypothetical protein HFF07_01790 [Oscillospiraceae bacterium]|nr:hypothetical protein [Oscillospiraceae bacterium]